MTSVASTITLKRKINVVLSRFSAAAELLDSEISLLLQLGLKAHTVSAGSSSCDIGRVPFFILSGWLCRSRTDENGNRSILEFLLPGDLVWPSAPHCSDLDLTVEVLADSVIVPATLIIDACKTQVPSAPGLSKGLEMYADLNRKHLLSQVSRLIQMAAPTRLHSLIIEIFDRLKSVSLSLEGSFACPLSQSVFADATGLSAVHVNRSFGVLTRAGLITRTRSLITIHTKASSNLALRDFGLHHDATSSGEAEMLRKAA
jgi:CRP-like cAMP-binding protein